MYKSKIKLILEEKVFSLRIMITFVFDADGFKM
jgi:hypothetical protein